MPICSFLSIPVCSSAGFFLLNRHLLRILVHYAGNDCFIRIYFIFFNDQFLNVIRPDASSRRIHDAVNLPVNFCIHSRILECKGGIQQSAVFHDKIVDIAHSLQTFYRTVDQSQVPGIPARYSPEIKESYTVTFSLFQKASFESSLALWISIFLTPSKE